MEEKMSENFFVRSRNVWFPDFEEKMDAAQRRCQRTSFHGMLILMRYFRTEMTRQQFLLQFPAQEIPEKCFPSDREKYLQMKALCAAYQNGEISGTELDERLLFCFRARPVEDVFAPAFESWDEIHDLLSRLQRKTDRLPVYFDGLGWSAYLKGLITGRQYAEAHMAFDTGSYLQMLLEYGIDKENLKETYSAEISVCLRLRKLCSDYRYELISTGEFETQFLQLAGEFCGNNPE